MISSPDSWNVKEETPSLLSSQTKRSSVGNAVGFWLIIISSVKVMTSVPAVISADTVYVPGVEKM